VFSKRSKICQAAALALRREGQGIHVLLVTSRQDGRWILPKGWVEDGEIPAHCAAREAYEEAGVEGRGGDAPLGTYRYRKQLSGKNSVRSEVTVFPLLVDTELTDWPEAKQRKRRWMSIETAGKKVGDRGLARLLRKLCDRDAVTLRRVMEALGEG
jgi:8-oxo-dGTP pyrophosphatase MutT (NUDIX family)